MIDRYISMMKAIKETGLVVFVVVCCMGAWESRIWLPVLVQGFQNGVGTFQGQVKTSMVRADRMMEVMAGPAGAMKRFIQNDLPPVTKAITGATGDLGGAARKLGDVAGSGKTALDAFPPLITAATTTFTNANATLVTINTTLQGEPIQGTIRNTYILSQSFDTLSVKMNTFMDTSNTTVAHGEKVAGYAQEVSKKARDDFFAPFSIPKFIGKTVLNGVKYTVH